MHNGSRPLYANDYRRHIQTLVKSGQLDDVPLSTESFRSYLELRSFNRLNGRIAAVNQAEIYPTSMIPFMLTPKPRIPV